MSELDLGTYLADDSLVLRGVPSDKYPKGRAYRIKSPSAKFGLLLHRIIELTSVEGVAPLTDDEVKHLVALATDEEGHPVDFTQRLLGGAYNEMLDDGVSAERLEMIRTVVLTHYGSGAHIAKMLVEQSGEAQARANRAARRTAKKTAGSKSRRASTAATGSVKAPTSPTSGSSTSQNGSEAAAQAV